MSLSFLFPCSFSFHFTSAIDDAATLPARRVLVQPLFGRWFSLLCSRDTTAAVGGMLENSIRLLTAH